MPLHDLKCDKGHIFETYIPLRSFSGPSEGLLFTCHCGSAARIVHLRAPMVSGDLPGYSSPIDGRWVEGKRARREDLKRNNCVEYDPSIKGEYMKRQQRSTELLEKQVDEHVDREISLMPARKRELLEQELKAGADVGVERTAVPI